MPDAKHTEISHNPHNSHNPHRILRREGRKLTRRSYYSTVKLPVKFMLDYFSRINAIFTITRYFSPREMFTLQWLNRAYKGILYSAYAMSAFSIILFSVIVWDNYELDSHEATVLGTVRSASNTRTVVSFYTTAGVNILTDQPSVWFPSRLYEGQTVLLEYNRANPYQARISGRGTRYAIIPLLSLAGGYWISTFVALKVLRDIKKFPHALFEVPSFSDPHLSTKTDNL